MNKTKIALSLGGNIGDVSKTFEEAIAELANAGVCEIRTSSPYYSEAEECVSGTPSFTNIALTGSWNGTPAELFDICQKIEQESGRPENHRPGTSRTLDIDIILFGEQVYEDKKLTIPHIRAASRFFVIIPLNEIASDWTFPGKGVKISQIFDELTIKN